MARDPGVEVGFAVGFGGREEGWGVGLVETADEVGSGDVGCGDVECRLDGEKFIEGGISEESRWRSLEWICKDGGYVEEKDYDCRQH